MEVVPVIPIIFLIGFFCFLSGNPLQPLRAELHRRPPAGRRGGVRLLRTDAQRPRDVRRGRRAEGMKKEQAAACSVHRGSNNQDAMPLFIIGVAQQSADNARKAVDMEV